MELKTFESTYKICRRGEVTEYYNELEMQIFNSFIEEIPTADMYNQIISLRDAYDSRNLEISTIHSNLPHIIVDGVEVSQKALRCFFRYIQILFSLLGITNAIQDELNSDFHIFGSLVRRTKILPLIPDNSKYLLLTSDLVKKIVKDVSIGVDPVIVLRRIHFEQPKIVKHQEGTPEFTFHICAISYLAIRASTLLPCEKEQDNIIGNLRPAVRLSEYSFKRLDISGNVSIESGDLQTDSNDSG